MSPMSKLVTPAARCALIESSATARSRVIDMKAYSTPPLTPYASFSQKLAGSSAPEIPR